MLILHFGGQGINIGLQHANKLNWILAITLTHSARYCLFDEYYDKNSYSAKTLANKLIEYLHLFLVIIDLPSITYRSSNVYDYGISIGSSHQTTPQPGDCLPYVIFSPSFYHLILFENQQLTKVNQFVEFIKKEYSKMIQIHDSNEEKIPLQFDGAILIRPDGYIVYRTNVFDIKHFQ
ncbi:unnamed protein product [Rotaria sp. Silwood1]|nr:unnamed protein product [Rotaria sp. Silwood1]CAF3432357.1 unnamed protein product [Rotaria sp. Silwood1]CAF3447851.1 unnamed protein product [Rotaria sp. Silwood1]